MSQQSSGMRFDIYERVHLSEEVPSIQELNEIELVPHIEVVSQGEQAILRGSLLLAGSYSSDDESRSNQTLEHLIPVEITLPKKRVRSLEEIGVDIENFDIDVLSSRSLNVTGVLSLNGVESITDIQSEDYRNDTEMVFVHEKAQPSGSTSQPKVELAAAEEDRSEESEAEAEVNEQEQAVNEPSNAASEPKLEPAVAEEQAQANEPIVQEVNEEPEQAAEEEASKEPKIAFTGKNAAEMSENQSLKTLLQPQQTKKRDTAEGASQQKEQAEVASVSPADALEWKKLFINEENEPQAFSKVRMCIVQKEETLESIAERYNMNPNEIRLYNRIEDHNLTEGQLIYIPAHVTP